VGKPFARREMAICWAKNLSYNMSRLTLWRAVWVASRINVTQGSTAMSILANVIDPRTRQPRSQMFWLVFGALVAAQLFAFWLLCSHQVRRAEARNNEVVVQQMALADCLQYIPGSTIASCSVRIDPNAPAAQPAASPAPAVTGAVPVSFSFR
jgi:hypothetical protein